MKVLIDESGKIEINREYNINSNHKKKVIINGVEFDNYGDYFRDLAKRNGCKNYGEYRAKKKGISLYEYNKIDRERRAKKCGYKDFNEYQRTKYHERGIHLPMNVNKESSSYFGVCLSEYILSKIFVDIERTKYGFSGYDGVCKNKMKIEIKSRCLDTYNRWAFPIGKNNVADYFVLLAFDERKKLNLLHLWLINGNEIINNRKLNDYLTLSITNKMLNSLEKYELKNKIDEVNKVCNEFKRNDNINANNDN